MLAGAGLVACDSSSSPRVVDIHGSVLAPEVLLAPRTTPRGWFVSSVENYSRSDRMEQTLYAPSDARDLTRAKGIVVGEGGEGLDIPLPGKAAKRIPNLGPDQRSGRLAHFGAYTVLRWNREPRRSTFVIGRGFPDTDIVRVARAAVFDNTPPQEEAPSIPAAALPAGMRRVAVAPLLPRENRRAPESIQLVSARGRHFVRMLAYRLDPAARAVDNFLVDLPAYRPKEASVERRIGATTVLVRGAAPRSVIEALARSVGPRRPVTSSNARRVVRPDR